MAATWTAAAAVSLGLSAAALLWADAGVGLLVFFLLVVTFASWGYALVEAAHGSRGALAGSALVALLVALVAARAAVLCRSTDMNCGNEWANLRLFAAGVVGLVALVASVAAAAEWRRRRGPPQWGRAVGYALAPALLALVRFTLY